MNSLDIIIETAQEYPKEFLLGVESGRAAVLLSSMDDTTLQIIREGSNSRTGHDLFTVNPNDIRAQAAFVLGVSEEVHLALSSQEQGVTV
jgi:hypothetical protein